MVDGRKEETAAGMIFWIIFCGLMGWMVLKSPLQPVSRDPVAGYVLDSKYVIGKGDVSDPCFSSDINKIAFVGLDPMFPENGKMGSGLNQVFLLDRQALFVAQVTQLKYPESADSADFCIDDSTSLTGRGIAWSASGKVTAYVEDGQLFVEEYDQGPRRLLALLIKPSPFNNDVLAVSPNGNFVAFSDERRSVWSGYCADQIFVVNLQTGEIKQVTKFLDYGINTLVFSPDGKNIGFIAVRCSVGRVKPGDHHVGFVDLDKSVEEFKDLKESHWVEKKSLFFSPDGALFGFIVHENEESSTFYIYHRVD